MSGEEKLSPVSGADGAAQEAAPASSDLATERRALTLTVGSLREQFSKDARGSAVRIIDTLASDTLHEIEELRVSAGLPPKDAEINTLLGREEEAESNAGFYSLTEDMLKWAEAGLAEIPEQ